MNVNKLVKEKSLISQLISRNSARIQSLNKIKNAFNQNKYLKES